MHTLIGSYDRLSAPPCADPSGSFQLPIQLICTGLRKWEKPGISHRPILAAGTCLSTEPRKRRVVLSAAHPPLPAALLPQ